MCEATLTSNPDFYSIIDISMCLTPKRGKPRNAVVDESFTEVINDKFKGGRDTCMYCQKEFDRNTSRLQDHLNVC